MAASWAGPPEQAASGRYPRDSPVFLAFAAPGVRERYPRTIWRTDAALVRSTVNTSFSPGGPDMASAS